MRNYETPNCLIVTVEDQDVICLSGPNETSKVDFDLKVKLDT